MRNIKEIIVHCSDSTFGDVPTIRAWHTSPPRNWKDIGYHIVILNGHPAAHSEYNAGMDGVIQPGRPVAEIGAHCLNHNADSIGVCLVGKTGPYTHNQMEALYTLLRTYMLQYKLPVAAIIGHRETDTGKAQGKTCPNMDMNIVRAELTRRMETKHA